MKTYSAVMVRRVAMTGLLLAMLTYLGCLHAAAAESVRLTGEVSLLIPLGKRSPDDGPYAMLEIRIVAPAAFNGKTVHVGVERKSELQIRGATIEDGDTIEFNLPKDSLAKDAVRMMWFADLEKIEVRQSGGVTLGDEGKRAPN